MGERRRDLTRQDGIIKGHIYNPKDNLSSVVTEDTTQVMVMPVKDHTGQRVFGA